MLSFENLIAFSGAAILLSWVPGPDNLFVLTQSALYGRLVGFQITLGLCMGLLLHTIAVSLGVAAIFQTSQTAFSALKIIGATYLLYLAYKAFTAKANDLNSYEDRNRPAWRMLARGIIMNVTNPKVAIFFLAFLPQFTDPSKGSIILQMLTLGAVFIVCALSSFSVILMLAGALSQWLRKSTTSQLWLNRGAGGLLVGLAIKLAAAHR